MFMFSNHSTRSALDAAGGRGGFRRRRRVASVLLGAVTAVVGLSAPAAAVPVSPIALNTAHWSGGAGFGSSAPAWFKDGFGFVHLQGAARQTSGGLNADLLGVLPGPARPTRVVYTVVHTFGGTYADLSIAPSGQIRLIAPRPPAVQDYGFVSLEDISYQQFLPVNPIVLNTANWSGSAGFGSAAPAWHQDGSFVVHLQGAVRQTSATGPNANVIGTVLGAAPNRFEYTVAHTFAGTYADLEITSSGQIRLLDPRPPAVKDYRFVSLEGVSYQQFQPGNPIPVNTGNWSASAGFGSQKPAWLIDAAGLVHLQGAARQTNPLGPNANLVGTLPGPARPTRVVYGIALTLSGTYADLSIAPTGQIRLIGPRPPAVEDYRFLSLDSICYQP
jgi:hypothetical protein